MGCKWPKFFESEQIDSKRFCWEDAQIEGGHNTHNLLSKAHNGTKGLALPQEIEMFQTNLGLEFGA